MLKYLTYGLSTLMEYNFKYKISSQLFSLHRSVMSFIRNLEIGQRTSPRPDHKSRFGYPRHPDQAKVSLGNFAIPYHIIQNK